MASRSIVTTIVRQRAALGAIRFSTPQQRWFQVSASCLQTEKQAGAKALSNRVIAKVRKERNIVAEEPTRFIFVEALPATATPEDIRKLAREAFPNGDKSISEIVFVRGDTFDVTGNCYVAMDKPEDAQRLIEYGHLRMVGGNVVRMSHVKNIADKARKPQLMSADGTSASGRSVLFVGLPPMTQPTHLLGFLRARNFYPEDGTVDSVIRLETKKSATVSKFLVRFDSETEAWRAVRTFHNYDFVLSKRNQTFRLQASVVY